MHVKSKGRLLNKLYRRDGDQNEVCYNHCSKGVGKTSGRGMFGSMTKEESIECDSQKTKLSIERLLSGAPHLYKGEGCMDMDITRKQENELQLCTYPSFQLATIFQTT